MWAKIVSLLGRWNQFIVEGATGAVTYFAIDELVEFFYAGELEQKTNIEENQNNVLETINFEQQKILIQLLTALAIHNGIKLENIFPDFNNDLQALEDSYNQEQNEEELEQNESPDIYVPIE